MSELPIAALVGASFDAVIFDLDGTLIDSYVAMIRSYERWAQEFKIDLDLLPSHLGMPSAAVCEALLPPELVEAAAERIEVLEVTDTEGIIALPGALEALQELPRNRVAIATSCTADLMRARVTAAGLPFPDVIVTRDQVAEGKPAPDSFLRAATLLGFDPARTLVVEDAPAGIAAARAAGCMVLGIASSQPAENLAADAVVADLSEVAWQVADDGVVTLQTTTV
ncbi:MAG: HAD-IA family hydrolase [Propionibacteriaceae bacterium]|nr:HAD-IA family hydrolase [Propionibacteriaceae bacterium]